jgi:spore coat polysaccharide biosynthesis protein SpsF
MKPVLKKPLLGFLIDRLRRVKLADSLIIATSTAANDDVIANFCRKENVLCFRGSRDDVLERFHKAAEHIDCDVIVRICADCPLIDPFVIDECIQFFQDHTYDWVANFVERRYPRGYEVEVFSRAALNQAAADAQLEDEREHVTPYLYRHPELFRLGSVVGKSPLGRHRWVVDTPEDFELIAKILSAIYPTHPLFTTQDVLGVLEKHPDWEQVNAHINQRTVKGLPGDVQ